MRRLLGVVVAAGIIAGSTAVAQDINLAPRETAPIYLSSDSDGKVYTIDVQETHAGSLASLTRRDVSPDEIIDLKNRGFDVRLLPPPSVSISKSSNSGSNESSLYISQNPSVPAFFSVAQVGGVVYGNFYVTGAQPPGKHTQFFAAYVKTSRMQNFGSHLAIILLASTNQLLYNYPPTYAPAAVGNGSIIGNVGGTINGCGYGGNHTPVYNMEVESFWNGGNKLYADTCSPSGLADGISYDFGVSATIQGYVAYGLTGGATWASPSPYTVPDRPTGSAGTLTGGGFIVAMVANPSDHDQVTVAFTYANMGWY